MRIENIWDKLCEIQNQVNRDIVYKTDIELYEKADFWNIVEGSGEGDCDDYAVTKRKLLREYYPENKQDFRMATCWTERDEYHAVLIVVTDDGDYVMDNRYGPVMAWNDLKYRWDRRESAEGHLWEKL